MRLGRLRCRACSNDTIEASLTPRDVDLSKWRVQESIRRLRSTPCRTVENSESRVYYYQQGRGSPITWQGTTAAQSRVVENIDCRRPLQELELSTFERTDTERTAGLLSTQFSQQHSRWTQPLASGPQQAHTTRCIAHNIANTNTNKAPWHWSGRTWHPHTPPRTLSLSD